MKYAAFNINLDSLGEAYGFPAGYRDPVFFEVMDRFLALADKYHFKYSIYIIGKDLENPAHRERVREWARAGHEIGNHSWSHPMNFGALSRERIVDEVHRTHEAIVQSIGIAPTGFIAPAWSASHTVYDVLRALGYRYDTSVVPSWLMIPAMIKNIMNYRGDTKSHDLMNRRDITSFFRASRHLQTSVDGFSVIPVPTNQYRIPCWHTLGFVLGWALHRRILTACLREIEAFYYLMHPADLMDMRDVDRSRPLHWERMRVPLAEKYARLEEMIQVILGSGRTIVTMDTFAQMHSKIA